MRSILEQRVVPISYFNGVNIVMRVALVNMPFASLQYPSLALTQVQTVLQAEFADRVAVDVHYFSHDFGRFFGQQVYQEIALSSDHLYAGLGDWLFRPIAFPDAPENSAEYFRRFYPRQTPESAKFRTLIETKRAALDRFLDRLIASYGLLDADVVGLTSMFAQTVACIALARRLKDQRPDIVTVLGGANCEGAMGRAIASHIAPIDFVVSGPGLISFPELVRRLERGAVEGPPIAGIVPNVRSPIAAGLGALPEVDLGPERPIDDVVLLDYTPFLDAFERQYPLGTVEPTLLFETSRGCWWGAKAHCTFCGLNGSTMTYRSMSAAHALEQFQRLFEYAPRCPKLSCVDNILPKSYLHDVLPHLHPPPGVGIFYEIKADLSAEDVRTLSLAGVRTVQPGIESLSTSTLKLMRKGTSVFTNLRLLIYCRLYDVSPMWNLLMGFPGEEEAVFDKYIRDIPLLYHLMPPSGTYPVRFDRFSPYFEAPSAYGIELSPLDMYQYVYPFSRETIKELAYYFLDENFSANYQVAMRSKIQPTRDAVVHWQQRFGGVDGGLPAELFLEEQDGAWIVNDSRSGALVRATLSNERHMLLARLAQPVNRPELADHESLDWLCAQGFVFQENDRVMSIVAPEVPARVAVARAANSQRSMGRESARVPQDSGI